MKLFVIKLLEREWKFKDEIPLLINIPRYEGAKELTYQGEIREYFLKFTYLFIQQVFVEGFS